MSDNACTICGYDEAEHVGDGEMVHAFRAAHLPAVVTAVELAAEWSPVGYCRECGHNLRHHVDPGGCCIGDCPCEATS